MKEERPAQPDGLGGEGDGEVALLEAGADRGGVGDRGSGHTLAAPESGRQGQRADRKERTSWAHGYMPMRRMRSPKFSPAVRCSTRLQRSGL